MRSGKHTCAIIVTFHPDAGLPDRIAAVVPQTGGLVIVDNGSSPDVERMLVSITGTCAAGLIRNTHNLGIAMALNQGAAWAIKRGFQYLLFLDQDSTPSSRMVSALEDIYHEAGGSGRSPVAVVGAAYTKSQTLLRESNNGWVETSTVITSGSFVPVSAFRRLGEFWVDLFIDHVDTEFCLRARANGYRIIRSYAPLMWHSIGAETPHRLPWSKTGTSNHAPLRRYYMARNLLFVVRLYGINQFPIIVELLYVWAKSTTLMLAFERQRWQKAISILRGIRAGLTSAPYVR